MIPSTLRGLLRSAQRAPEGNTPEDDATSRALRDALVQELLVLGDLVTPSVVEAFRAVPRHVFCPSCPVDEAYANVAVPIGYE